MKKFKEKWGINSNFQLLIILFVFSITGSLALWAAKPILSLLSIERNLLSPWIFWPARILIIFPTYQILLIIIGTLFGQFNFFWQFEKKMLARLGFKQFEDNK